MTEYGKAQIQALGAGFVGFVVVVGAGALLMFPHGAASVKAPVSAYAPVDVTNSLSAPAPVARPVHAVEAAAAVASSPAPILADDERETPEAAEPAPAPAPAPAAVPSQAAAPAAHAPAPIQTAAAAPAPAPVAAPKLAPVRHLDVRGGSSARASAASSAQASALPAKKRGLDAKIDLSKTPDAVASSIHYGVNNRAELMGRAAGPVYNFAGKDTSADSAGARGQTSGAGTLQNVDAAQQQVDNSPLTEADKATLKEDLNKVRAAVDLTSGGAAGAAEAARAGK